MYFHATGDGGPEGLAIFFVLIGIAVTIFWMVVGWRAMRAHERLADALTDIAIKAQRDGRAGPTVVDAEESR